MIYGTPAIANCGGVVSAVQGTEIIINTTSKINEAIIATEKDEDEKAAESVKQAVAFWKAFTEQHDKIFGEEVEKLEPLENDITAISTNLERIMLGSGAKEGETILTNLKTVRQLLEDLLAELKLPVLLDFTGSRCKACKVMKPRLIKIAPDYKGKVRIVFIDVSKEKELTKEYRIMLIPTLVFINRDGKTVSLRSGETEERVLRKTLDGLVK